MRQLVLVLSAWLVVSSLAHAQSSPRAAQGREPTVREVIHMALVAAKTLSPERTRELARRARCAGLMPTLKVGAERGLEQGLSSSSSTASDRTNTSSGDAISLDATLTFELSRLVFAPEEVRLVSIERWLASDRRKLIEDVVHLYFQRRRLLRERAAARVEDPELDASIAEAEALLDAYTNGAFGNALAAARELEPEAAAPIATPAPVASESAAPPAQVSADEAP